MSSQDPMGSSVSPKQAQTPPHSGGDGLGDGLYEPSADTAPTDARESGQDASLKVPLSEHLENATARSIAGEQDAPGSLWSFAKRNHVPALLAIGGIAWLLTSLIRRATR
jgi:hypothetical protein